MAYIRRMHLRRTGLCFVLLAALASSASAQTAADFAGEWRPVSKTPGLASVNIIEKGGRWMARVAGACTPKPCDWGAGTFTVLQQKPTGMAVGMTTFRIGTSTRLLIFKLGEGALYVELYSLFSGAGDQPGYFAVEEMARPFRPPVSTSKPGTKR
jgi:hypothetical protein